MPSDNVEQSWEEMFSLFFAQYIQSLTDQMYTQLIYQTFTAVKKNEAPQGSLQLFVRFSPPLIIKAAVCFV